MDLLPGVLEKRPQITNNKTDSVLEVNSNPQTDKELGKVSINSNENISSTPKSFAILNNSLDYDMMMPIAPIFKDQYGNNDTVETTIFIPQTSDYPTLSSDARKQTPTSAHHILNRSTVDVSRLEQQWINSTVEPTADSAQTETSVKQ